MVQQTQQTIVRHNPFFQTIAALDRWGRIRGVVIGKQVPKKIIGIYWYCWSLSLENIGKCEFFSLQTYRTGDMAWWEKIADFWWGDGWEEWLVFLYFIRNQLWAFKQVHGGPLPFSRNQQTRSFSIFNHSIFTGRAVVAASMGPSLLPAQLLWGAHPWWPELWKSRIWPLMTVRYIFPIAVEAQLWRGGDDGQHGGIQVVQVGFNNQASTWSHIWKSLRAKVIFRENLFQCCNPVCGKRGTRERTWSTFGKVVEQILNRNFGCIWDRFFWYLGWCKWYSLINTTLHYM